MNKISYVTMGCPKNQVDTDTLIEQISNAGFGFTEAPEDADAIIINTCCFIDDAKRESIDAILQVAQQKRNGSKLVVMGCMGKRYKDDLTSEIPEIDVVFGVEDFDKILKYIRSEFVPVENKITSPFDIGTSYGYVKIADGCNRTCSFCVIPAIRGTFRSDRQDMIVRRVEELLARDVKEIILIAQDITGYGKDLDKNIDLSDLVMDIADRDNDFWIRLLYLYPAGVTDKLINVIAENEKVCSYFDIPIQHSENDILRSMRRGHTKDDIRRIIDSIRDKIPDAALRTALIAGYPGETDEHFERLKQFVNETEFDRLGVFKYSQQEDTLAYTLEGQVPEKVKDERYDEIMSIQAAISFKKNKELVGKQFRTLIDDVDGSTGIGRLYSHAPEIDGAVIIKNCPAHLKGKFANIKIREAYDYDLAGEIIDD
jgi:ribosomal protein S12 methylthiotransferase